MKATLTKIEWVLDENGKHLYDEVALSKYYNKMKKTMEKQNEKIKNSPSLQRSYSICDADDFAKLQCEIYKHHFRLTK
jgi:uncharacterized protein (UPF0261 family)